MNVLGVFLGLAAGLAVGLAALSLVPGIAGVGAAVALGAAAYAGTSLLFSRERRLRGVAVSEIPEGEKAAAAIDAAKADTDAVARLAGQVADAAIRAQAQGFVDATRGLIRYTEDNPASFRVLRHFSGTYASQAHQLLDTYLDIERSGARDQLPAARREALDAFRVLEKTAAGELSRAVASDALTLQASAAAIDRLASLDGYDPEEGASVDAGAADAGKPRTFSAGAVSATTSTAASTGFGAPAAPSAPPSALSSAHKGNDAS